MERWLNDWMRLVKLLDFNPFAHTFHRLRRRLATSAPSNRCRCSGGHGCSLARIDVDLLFASAKVNASLRNVDVYVPELRSACLLRIRAGALGRLIGLVAEKL
jgi:hypothetical protein